MFCNRDHLRPLRLWPRGRPIHFLLVILVYFYFLFRPHCSAPRCQDPARTRQHFPFQSLGSLMFCNRDHLGPLRLWPRGRPIHFLLIILVYFYFLFRPHCSAPRCQDPARARTRFPAPIACLTNTPFMFTHPAFCSVSSRVGQR
jgi:hypothetical protein